MSETVSLAALMASKSSAVQTSLLKSLSDDEALTLEHDWQFWGRANQIAPEGDWQTWLFLAGRGAGKTRAGAEWIRARVRAGGNRLALIAPTSADARDVMVEGESGIKAVSWEHDRTTKGVLVGLPDYEPSKRRLTWQNGAIATLFSAEEPERLRGPQHTALWGDELAAWKYMREAWDMAMFGLRAGERPQAMVTTTPKPLSLLRELLADPSTVVSRGTTFDNVAHLADSFLKHVRSKYEGTRLGRQELYAEILEEAEGALWSREMIDAARHQGDAPEMNRVVVAVDPAITAHEDSNETGIIAAGIGVDDNGYVLKDVSGRYSPGGWAKKAIELYHEVEADRIVAEGNQGGEMVRHTLQTEWKAAPVTIVHAHRGKQARAEPVAALYEQGRVKHVGHFMDLEDQLVNWAPLSGMPSPDRLDALVWALTDLMIGPGVEHAFW